MKPIHLFIGINLLIGLILIASATAYYDMDCDIRTTSCLAGETPLLYLYNQSANYSNSHVQLINFTGTKYPSVLCCNSTEMPIGNLSNGTSFLYLWNITNSHVQWSRSYAVNYSYPVYISSAALPQPYCTLQPTCGTGYECLVSLHNETNSHVAGCSDPYSQKVCCINREPHTWSTVPDFSLLFSNPVTSVQTAIANLGIYISNNWSAPTFAASSDSSFLTCWVVGNTLYVQDLNGGAGSGTCYINSTESGYPYSYTNITMTYTFATTAPGGGGGGGVPAIDSDNDTYSDITEQSSGTDPFDAEDHPQLGDKDNDGYTDTEEGLAGTNPEDPESYPVVPPVDTDGDGFSDAEELKAGTDPNNADSKPAVPVEPTKSFAGIIKMFGIAVLIFLIIYGLNWFIAWDEDRKKKKKEKVNEQWK